ncbi:peptidase M50 [Methanoculleus taiwanensis]|uniref:Peptidase M50 n=1 Tax=Methanoculleus taiwanensis TaxID=1550565 RepID=A0A498H6J8_9EURY|nr:site-2 protease family protein [Methanoculleus taiwanensis]RXE57458.1 peptidase M50 [Methanoculleus taiwanensis]
MSWLQILIFLLAAYLLIAGYIRRRGLFADRISFYGPIMAVKSSNVGFFDIFRRATPLLRVYGTFGVGMVVLVSIFISLMLFLSVQITLILQPEPIGIYEPQNILLLPGINEFVPSTFAVWIAFILTIAIHEFGHAILCRVENIRVKSVGALIAVIPIGFFVEPDEEDLEKTRGLPKARMFGAGITNNIVIGVISLLLMIAVAGLAVPAETPVIQGVYQDYPAAIAGVPPGSIVTGVNGIDVANREDISRVLAGTQPGDQVTLTAAEDGTEQQYTLTLAEWPEEFGENPTGFMGIYYYDAPAVMQTIEGLASPLGFLQILTVPFDTSYGGQMLRILAFDTPDQAYYQTPFPAFWEVVQLLFWVGWININVGIFNAIPMVPLDGGYIMREGVERVLSWRGLSRFTNPVVSSVSWAMFLMLISLIALPYLLHLF